ncbi:DUF5312 domain-containing protein [Treponema sp.]
MGAFSGRSPFKVFEDQLISSLGSSIVARAPGLYNPKQGVLLPAFYEELRSLKDSARFFYDTLDASIVRDKGAFFVFLASLEMDFIHRRITAETDPAGYAGMNSQASESDIRLAVNRALEAILQTIDDDQRRIMYRNVRSLLCLKELGSFLFDRALSTFTVATANDGPECPVYLLRDQLSILNDVLFSLDFPPSMPLLESLFVFNLQDRMEERHFDMDTEMHALLIKADEALTRIRLFNKKVPLTAILRCASRNLAYMPQVITGGEDWFAVYRDFWRRRVDERYAQFIKSRRLDLLSGSIAAFFNRSSAGKKPSESTETEMTAMPLRGLFAVSFLAEFQEKIFISEIYKALKPVLIEGEFYKRENRAEFTEAYNELLKLGDSVRILSSKMLPSGEIGKRYEAARVEILSLPAKKRKIQALIEEAETEVSTLVVNARKAIKTLCSVLSGITDGEVGGRYDSLSNLGSLISRNTGFMAKLRNALQRMENALQLLGDIEATESIH